MSPVSSGVLRLNMETLRTVMFCEKWMYLLRKHRRAARTLFVRLYLAHFCSFFRHFFAVSSVLTPGFQKVAPKDRGPVPQRSKTAAKRVVAAVL